MKDRSHYSRARLDMDTPFRELVEAAPDAILEVDQAGVTVTVVVAPASGSANLTSIDNVDRIATSCTAGLNPDWVAVRR